MQQRRSRDDAYRELMAAVIARAIDDLKGIGPPCRKTETDLAMEFVLGEDCEAWCLEIGVNCETVRKKAAVLYRRIVANEAKESGGKKRPGRPLTGLKSVRTRQSPGKRRIATDR